MHGGKATTGSSETGGGWRGSRWRIAAWTVAALIWLLPLVAMQFTDQVNWDEVDFASFGLMLLAAGGVFEAAVRTTGNTAYRVAVGIAVAAGFVLVWMNLAVGVIGSENDPANLMFGGVLAVGIAGAVIARFRPAGMARALIATAFAQALVAVIALLAGSGATGPIRPGEVLMLTGFFTALWLMAAWLFRKAAREQAPITAAS